MARGDFPRRHCKIIFQSIVVLKLAVPRSTRGTAPLERQAGRYAKQRRHRNRHAMDTLTLRPGGTLSQQRRDSHAVGPGVSLHTEISPILWPIQRIFTSRSSICVAMRAQRRKTLARSYPWRRTGVASRSLDWDSRNHRRGSASGDISRGAIGRARKRHQHRRIHEVRDRRISSLSRSCCFSFGALRVDAQLRTS